jgi:hypothetical protein
MFKKIVYQLVTSALIALFVFSSFGAPGTMAATKKDVRADAQKFIDEYSAMWTKLRYRIVASRMAFKHDDLSKATTRIQRRPSRRMKSSSLLPAASGILTARPNF